VESRTTKRHWAERFVSLPRLSGVDAATCPRRSRSAKSKDVPKHGSRSSTASIVSAAIGSKRARARDSAKRMMRAVR